MRAVVIPGFHHEPELADVPAPQPGADEVLVRLEAAGMNPFDWKVIDGALRGSVDHRFPLVLGSDGAGEVVETGGDVTRLSVGDRVYGQFLRVSVGAGSFADYATKAATKLARLPDEVPYDVAAALPTSGV
ncbi:MAG TPA: alcohol dehydrogenase catalytic domain-containing protein, partial [Marmoricola sp.]|nr:alcohol dehydrogenase catalytic domain-containing protein [Marmoricola sp.]